ncbi:hypothetical protein [Streptomyces sp. NPDC051219]|uniref:hypothetical protein n=1 Tax=Streptomyces sp. NPDC051219 TaxID=3155283 RepID=UPI003420CC72
MKGTTRPGDPGRGRLPARVLRQLERRGVITNMRRGLPALLLATLPLLPAVPTQAWGTAAPQAATAAAVPLPGAAPAQEVLPLFEAIDRRYVKPSAEAIAEVTSLLAPGDSRR